MPDGTLPAADGRIEAAVRAVLDTLAATSPRPRPRCWRSWRRSAARSPAAKQEIASLRVDDITEAHIPAATDELDAIVGHTAQATNEILDCCETLEGVAARVGPAEAEALQGAITRIYEACSFQDITGQRIGKVVAALKAIESRIGAVTERFGAAAGQRAAPPAADAAETEGRRLANGPQLPARA
jgi:chemotaxis protein CheZ